MANTKIPAELSSTPGIIDNSNATAITIDSSENVGIGAAPTSVSGLGLNKLLEMGGATAPGLVFRPTSSTSEHSVAGAGDGLILSATGAGTASNNAIRFFTSNSNSSNSPTERMRIDSSGNLLVSKTASSFNAAGAEIRTTGVVIGTVDGAAGLIANRLTSDGTLIQLSKDGTTVGSIGSASGVVSYIVLDPRTGVKGAGLLGSSADANTGILQPTDNSGSTADAAIQLGTSSNRFKDLYLSGGVYVGGTGSANKLDDYEEGTWTPTSGVNLTVNTTCRYTKIGNHLTVTFDFSFASNSDGNSVSLNSIPFSYTGYNSGFNGWQNLNLSGPVMWHVSGTSAALYNGKTNGVVTYADASGKRVIGTITGIVG